MGEDLRDGFGGGEEGGVVEDGVSFAGEESEGTGFEEEVGYETVAVDGDVVERFAESEVERGFAEGLGADVEIGGGHGVSD